MSNREEQRNACIEAICDILEPDWRILNKLHARVVRNKASKLLDSLHGIVFVDPIKATEEMDIAGAKSIEQIGDAPTLVAGIFRAMAAAGDLTNAPQKKP